MLDYQGDNFDGSSQGQHRPASARLSVERDIVRQAAERVMHDALWRRMQAGVDGLGDAR